MGSGESDAAYKAKELDEKKVQPILFPPHTEKNPPCIWCNGPTQRTGMCFTCLACGNTTSC